MAKIWYVREGGTATIGGPRCDLPFEKFEELFEGFETEYLGTEPPRFRFPSAKPALDAYRAEQFVVLQVQRKELGHYPQMKEGFYLIMDLKGDVGSKTTWQYRIGDVHKIIS